MRKDLVPNSIVLNKRGDCTPSHDDCSNKRITSSDQVAPLSGYPELHDSSNYSNDSTEFQEYTNNSYKKDGNDNLIQHRPLVWSVEHSSDPVYESEIIVESRYIAPASYHAKADGFTSISIKSDMNSGKSHSVALDLVNQNPESKLVSVLIVHMSSLNAATARSIQSKTEVLADEYNRPDFRRTVVNYEDLNVRNVDDADLITTTFNNLPRCWELIQSSGKSVNTVYIDESESGAQFMASGTISNKSQSGRALNELSNAACFRVVMDAHLGRGTKALVSYFMPNHKFSRLANSFSVWEGHTYSWESDVMNGLIRIQYLLARGENVFVPVTSASLAAKLESVLLRSGVLEGVSYLNAFHAKGRPDSSELKDAKKDTSKFKNYRLVIASPTCGTGLSIEESDEVRSSNSEHFDSIVCFMVRDKGTPDAISSMQMPFRVRHFKTKHIYLIKVDQIERGSPEPDWMVQKDSEHIQGLKKFIIESHQSDAEKSVAMSHLYGLHSAYECELACGLLDDFERYYEIIDEEFKHKKIKCVDAPPVECDGSVYDALDMCLKDASALIRQAEQLAKINAPDITEEEAALIRSCKRFNSKSVTSQDIDSLSRFDLIKAYHSSDLPPSREQLEQYIQYQDDGIAFGRNNIARALLSLSDINTIQKAYHDGAGLNQLYKRDVADIKDVSVKAYWKIDRLLCAVVGLSVDQKGVYSLPDSRMIDDCLLRDKSMGLHGRSFVRSLREQVDTYNSLKPSTRISPKQLNENPVGVFSKLIKDRLKVKLSKVRGSDAYVLSDTQVVIDNLNIQSSRGSFGDQVILNRITAELSVDESGEFTPEVKLALGIDGTIQEFVKRCLEKVSARSHGRITGEYLRRARLPRVEGDRFSPLARANQYLLDCAGVDQIPL